MTSLPLAVQLYTLRDETRRGFAATVREVARIGYPAVELAGYGNLPSANDARKALDDAGLIVAGSHASLEALEKDPGKVLDENEELRNRTIVISSIPKQRRRDAAGWKNAAQTLSRIAARCNERGFALAYHNHAFEFEKFDGRCGLDILREDSDPAVKIELDVYWVKYGGEDPVSYINTIGSRLLLLHLKDMAAGPDRRFAEVGSGTLDFRGILRAGQKAGVRWYIVEQDDTYGRPAIEAVRSSFENLKNLGAV